MRSLTFRRIGSALLWLATVTLHAQTFTTLLDFDGTNGSEPLSMSLVQGRDGDLYGTTFYGGANDGCSAGYLYYGCGTVFKITAEGQIKSLYSFCSATNCTDGALPNSGLILATDGNFYGTTSTGGANCVSKGGCGTVFKITAAGNLTTLFSFCAKTNCANGFNPQWGVIQAADGNFYGTTSGGIFCFSVACGTIFKLSPTGALTTLYTFCSRNNCTDGARPQGLMQASDGNFYGITQGGGINGDLCKRGCGTVFRISPSGKLATLHRFCSEANCADGYYPSPGMIQGGDGDLYGTTSYGGGNRNGEIFKLTRSGELTNFYNFCSQFGCTDGAQPAAGLIQGSDGNLYGTTSAGGGACVAGCGTVFEITPNATLTTLYEFCNVCNDGIEPQAALMQATNGNFYGTTPFGSEVCGPDAQTCGTVFSLENGLGPFVSLLRSSGKVGQIEDILGQGLTGATGVFFNGTSASFTVISDTYVRATVPTEASTGIVTVVTPSVTLTSNGSFHLMP